MALARKRSKYVTYEEFEPVKKQTDTLTAQVQLLTIRVEVLTNDLHKLTLQVGDIAEDLEKGFTMLLKRMDKLDQRLDGVEKKLADGLAAILAAVMRPAPGRG